MSKINQLDLADLNIILATRDIARFAVQTALDKHCKIISFRGTHTASRSFLDELYTQSQKNAIKIINIPEEIEPLFEIIERSHREQRIIAPRIKVRLSNKVFA